VARDESSHLIARGITARDKLRQQVSLYIIGKRSTSVTAGGFLAQRLHDDVVEVAAQRAAVAAASSRAAD
jgi:hypothetical protein